jgi:uncharacterized protein YuzE
MGTPFLISCSGYKLTGNRKRVTLMELPHRITFDRGANTAYIYLREIEPGGVARTVTVNEAPGLVNLDFDKSKKLIGIELLPATKLLPPELLKKAERI